MITIDVVIIMDLIINFVFNQTVYNSVYRLCRSFIIFICHGVK